MPGVSAGGRAAACGADWSGGVYVAMAWAEAVAEAMGKQMWAAAVVVDVSVGEELRFVCLPH